MYLALGAPVAASPLPPVVAQQPTEVVVITGDAPDINFDGTLDYDTNRTREVGSFTTLNLQARYTGIPNVRLLVGVDNVLDEDPPFAIGDGDTDLYGYVQSQHSPRGGFWNAKAIFTF